MYRFLLRPKWLLFHVVVLTGVVGMLFLARWQWNKHIARDDFVAMVETRQGPKVQAQDLVTLMKNAESPADIEWYRVTATGTYLADAQLQQINRTQDGANGSNVLTPFRVDGGPILIVNRGFVPNGVDVPPPPSGTLLIGGTARTTQLRRTGELTDAETDDDVVVRRVDLALISERLQLDLADVYVDFIASKPASAAPPTPVPPPDLGGGPPHVSYTVQWIFFSMSVAAGWVFAVRRSLKTRRQSALPAVSAGPPAEPSA